MTVDTASAVAALQAASAGDDTNALADAIINASFLDQTPGEDRQKLRGASAGSSNDSGTTTDDACIVHIILKVDVVEVRLHRQSAALVAQMAHLV